MVLNDTFVIGSYGFFSFVFALSAIVALKYKDFLLVNSFAPFNKANNYNLILKAVFSLFFLRLCFYPLTGKTGWLLLIDYLYTLVFFYSLYQLITKKDYKSYNDNDEE